MLRFAFTKFRALLLLVVFAVAIVPARPAVAQTDPRWGVLAEMAERDFRKGDNLLSFRWDEPGKKLDVVYFVGSPLLFGEAPIRQSYELDEQSGVITLRSGRHKEPFRAQANGDLMSLTTSGRDVWTEGSGIYVFRGTRWVSELGGVSRRLAKAIASGHVRAANPALSVAVAATTPSSSVTSAPLIAQIPQLIAPVTISAGPRLALVIGNSAYGPSMGALPNPANDADAMAAALKTLGFTVHLVKNADQNVMKRAIVRFGQRLTTAGKGATGLFFYAGHGIQHRGINYLVPVSAQISSQADVDIEAVAADTVLQQMEEAGTSTNIVILDACRNMPLARGFRSASAGLAPMDAPNGSFIAYSTAPGSVAADGAGANSPFVTALIKNISRKGEPIESIFRDVRRSVLTQTEGAQTPWDSSSLIAPFYFAGQ